MKEKNVMGAIFAMIVGLALTGGPSRCWAQAAEGGEGTPSAPSRQSPAPAPAQQYRFGIRGDGIFRNNIQNEIQDAISMLKAADQTILDVEIVGQNGYGTVLAADIIYTPKFQGNSQVLQNAKTTTVTIDGIWGGNSIGRIAEMVSVLKAADQIILNVQPTGRNGYGKILSATITHISKYQYDALMGGN